MTWFRTCDEDEGLWLYFEVGADGWAMRQVERRASDLGVVATACLQWSCAGSRRARSEGREPNCGAHEKRNRSAEWVSIERSRLAVAGRRSVEGGQVGEPKALSGAERSGALRQRSAQRVARAR